jgi:hypothetical protein
MAKHDEMLEQGPRDVPEPETADERSRRLGMKTAGGAVVGGGVAVAKIGAVGKVFLYLVAWHGIAGVWRIAGWLGIAAVALAITLYFVLRSRREQGA